MNKILHTKYGIAKIHASGYYRITSRKEGNNSKLLHRLIARDYFGDWIDDPNEPFDIHHIDGNKLNNCVLNLEPISKAEHNRIHSNGENNPMYGKEFTNEHRLHLSEGQKNRVRTEKDKENFAIKMNKSGYYMVSKMKEPRVTQGFIWRYQYYENGKRKAIKSIDLDKLEKKVKEKGLKWRRL